MFQWFLKLANVQTLHLLYLPPNPLILFGAARVARTPDLRITNAPLYQLSYGGLKGSDDFIEAVICL